MSHRQIDDLEEIENLFSEIEGQLKGNKELIDHFNDFLNEINSYIHGRKKLKETNKRSIANELKEKIRHLKIENINSFAGDKE